MAGRAWNTSIAYGATVTGWCDYTHSPYLPSSPECVTDGTSAGSPYGAGVFTAGTYNRGWEIDLGAGYILWDVVLVHATGNGTLSGRPNNVSYSTDGSSWTTVLDAFTNIDPDPDWATGDAHWRWDPADAQARYLRFYETVYLSGYHVGSNIVDLLIDGDPVPSPFVLADWDGDGFGGWGSTDDLTGDTESWRITRGASAEITGGATPGTATVILNNPSDDRYNPLNTGGPLYGKLRDGVSFWIGVNPDGSVTGTEQRGLFGGRIKDITPVPSDGGGRALKVEITCEDALSWLDRTPVTLADALSRSQGAIRSAILTAAGETSVVLPSETATVTLSSWDGSALGALETLNRANGSRHFIRPADVPDDWYDYVCRNRQWNLDGTTDASVDAGADYLTGTDGWRLSADTVINQQRATVTPITFTSGQVSVWEADGLPFTFGGTRIIWPEFDDFVDSPVVDINYTGTAPTVTLESFGSTAKVTLVSAGSTTVTSLSIEGRLARRATAESYIADDLTSQAGPRGIRAGSDISGDWVGGIATAGGIAEHVVWRYGSPQYRPSVTIHNWLPEMFEVDLFDVITVTIAQLGMTARHFEVVGLTLEGRIAASAAVCHHILTLVLQECRVQADPGWFILDTSLLNGTDILAY
jgi:hypothetical protein